jgi:tetratricopeptide (TPR) repeat protein
MREEFDSMNDAGELNDLVGKFADMIKQEKMYFFDVDEFEDIIDFYLERNNAKKASVAIDHALRQYPASVTFLLRKAQYLTSVNKSVKALEILNNIEGIEPNNPDIYITKGTIFSKLKKFKEAISEYNKAANHSEEKDEIYTRIAFEFEDMNDFDKAIIYLTKAVGINPDNLGVIYELSFCYEVAGREEDAITFFNQFLDKHPYSEVAWFNLGIAYSNLGLYEKAVEAYDFALAIMPEFSSAYFNKANSMANIGMYRQAIRMYEETLKLEEPEGLTHFYIGECYEKLGDIDKAYDNFRLSVNIDPELAEGWMGLGILNDRAGNEKTALKYIQKAVQLDELNEDNLLYLADAYFRFNMINKSKETYEKVVEIAPENPDLWLDYSAVFAEEEDYTKAIDLILSGIENQPQNHEYYYRLAGYLIKKGREKEAFDNFELALKMNYEAVYQLFEFYPELKENITFLNLLEKYR